MTFLCKKNSFINDADTQLVKSIFDTNTYCTVSGVNFEYIFSVLVF